MNTPLPADTLHEAMNSDDARWELRSWLLLAVAALGIAGIFALMLALSRVPGSEDLVPWPLGFFQKGLVIHVVFSFVVWFLCILGALAVLATYWLDGGRSRGRSTGRSSIWMIAGAQILLLVPALKDETEASLNNYVPAILDPIYYLGLALLFMSLLFVLVRLFAAFFRRVNESRPGAQGILLTGLIYFAALVCFTVTFQNAMSEPASAELNERLFWGGGHVLQFINVGLMAIAWYGLAEVAGCPLPPKLFTRAMVLLTLSAFVGPALYAVYPLFSAAQTQAFTDLQYLLAPTAVLLAGAILLRRTATADPAMDASDRLAARLANHAIYLSIAVFFIGAFLGLFVDGADTRTPAHYHGVIGGVNLAIMGLVFCLLLPLMDRSVTLCRKVVAVFWLYGLGQTLHSLGLFFAGGYGAPRKVAGDVVGLEAIGAQASLYLMGIGAVIAVIGGVMFIWIVGKALLRPVSPATSER